MQQEQPRWGAFWSLVVIQSMNSLNEKGVQFLLIALGIWLGSALQYPLSVLIVLPFVIFSPLGGWIADRYCRTRLLQCMVLLQVAALAGMTFGLFMRSVGIAVGFFTVFCVQAMFFSPAKKGLVKDLVGSQHIGFASGILEISSMLALLLGQIGALGLVYYLLRLWGDAGGWHAAAWPCLGCTVAAVAVLLLSFCLPCYPAEGGRRFEWSICWEHIAQLRLLWNDRVLRFSEADGRMMYSLQTQNTGLLYYLYHGVKLGIFPPIIFMGVGAMTDFGPLIANPKSLLLGAAAQLGIFLTFIGAKLLGFSAAEAGSIGIIGGADGPTAIFVTTKRAPHLLGAIAVAAYSYMALVPVIQPPIMKALTTKKERTIRMGQLRPVSRVEMVIFPIMVTIIVSLLLPDAAALVGMLMLGNLFRVSGVVERLNKTTQNELCNIVTIFLGLTVGANTNGTTFLTLNTIKIVVLGVVAFGCGTAGGVLLAKLMNVLTGGKINPLIGSAGVSAVPMAARVSQKVGQSEDPGNFLLMHAMGPNVAGVIGSAVAAGVFISLFA